MRKICEMLKRKDVGSIGIGAMIVFIAMVLVAGIAASVLIQTSTKLESQAMKSGQETIAEVSTGIAVFNIEGYAPTDGDIDNLVITVRPRAGSADIDLNEVYIELSDTNYKIVLNYTAGEFVEDAGDGKTDIFGQAFFPTTAYQFGILVLEDADDSCTVNNPVINKGDKVVLGISTSAVFSSSGGIDVRTNIWGMVVPEQGSPGVISFTTPASYNENVFKLQ